MNEIAAFIRSEGSYSEGEIYRRLRNTLLINWLCHVFLGSFSGYPKTVQIYFVYEFSKSIITLPCPCLWFNGGKVI